MKLQNYIKAITKAAEEQTYGESPKELYEPLSYIMSLGGKRMRPALTLMAYNLYKEDWEKVIEPALAVEVFHNFTLLHDDIMDDAPLRRGEPTVHEKWNTNTAILSGDVMLVAAYELLGNIDTAYFKQAFKRFNRTAAEVCEGQQMDMNFETKDDVTADEYLEMIKLKTSVLLGFALELGGLMAGQDESEQALLYDIGINFGLGFQVKDDILDVFGDQVKVGKQVGGDIIENKKTWLLIKALELSEGKKEGLELRNWIAKKEFDKTEKVDAVRAIYKTLGIPELAEGLMESYFKKGFEDIWKLSCGPYGKQELKSFGEYLMAREH
jgi:geranylgeranyl diphosphate synthase, type II